MTVKNPDTTNPNTGPNRRSDRIRERLVKALNPTDLEIINESHLHAGHPGAKTGLGHFAVIIRADCLLNKSLLAQHRLIYDALGDMMQTDIHALRIVIAN